MELSESSIFSLIQSDQKFPIDFDDVWQWLDFSTKGNAKRSFERVGFIEGTDFCSFIQNDKREIGATAREVIQLTLECFKTWAMTVHTDRGKEVRSYFLNCEAELKRRIQEENENKKNRVVRACVSESSTSWVKRFDDSFFEEAYRVTGWKQPDTGHPPCMGGLIKNSVYEYFPDGVVDELDRVNPRTSKGRPRKHHQHLREIGLDVLENQKTAVYTVMRLSPSNNRARFKQNLQRALGDTIQLELPFLDDTYSV
jgi:phage anti-repressor protein